MPDGTERRDLAVEYRPLASLVAYARNARTHSEVQVASSSTATAGPMTRSPERRSEKKDTTGC
jgi:hypothetical protein